MATSVVAMAMGTKDVIMVMHPLVCVIETRDIKLSRKDGRASANTVDTGC